MRATSEAKGVCLARRIRATKCGRGRSPSRPGRVTAQAMNRPARRSGPTRSRSSFATTPAFEHEHDDEGEEEINRALNRDLGGHHPTADLFFRPRYYIFRDVE